MKKTFLLLLSLVLLSGCTFGENPDAENFEIQHQEPSMEEAEAKLFRDHQQ